MQVADFQDCLKSNQQSYAYERGESGGLPFKAS